MAAKISPEQAEEARNIARRLEAGKMRRDILRGLMEAIPVEQISQNAKSRQEYRKIASQLREADREIDNLEKQYPGLLAIGRLLLFKENFHAKR